MKKATIVAMLAIVTLLIFVGCSAQEMEFSGTIEELNDGSAIIKPTDTSAVADAGDRVHIDLPEDGDFTLGQSVTVRYSGDIMEGDPLKLGTILSVNGMSL